MPLTLWPPATAQDLLDRRWPILAEHDPHPTPDDEQEHDHGDIDLDDPDLLDDEDDDYGEDDES